MTTTTTIHEYRQHPVLVTKTSTDAGEYYMTTNEVTAEYVAESASDDDKAEDAKFVRHAYATEARAITAAEEEIDDALGHAEVDEVKEALDHLASAQTREETKRSAINLAQTLRSYAKSGDTYRTAESLATTLADTLRNATR
jgi:hypothetical protein